MAASEARLIVLATLLHLEPATGYAVRKHLADQGADAWAELGVASIYSVLQTLTKHGLLDAIGDPTGVRASTRAYRTTPEGRAAFDELWRSSIETVRPARPLAFHVAVTLSGLVTRETYIASLTRRLEKLEATPPELPVGVPLQVRHATRLWHDLSAAEAAWIRTTLSLAQSPEAPLEFAPS